MIPSLIPNLTTLLYGRQSFFVKQTRSTQDDLKKLIHEGIASEGTILRAGFQTHGRGRMERTWISLPGDQLSFSICLKPCFSPEMLGWYSILFGYCVIQTLKELKLKSNIQLKWPNDVLIESKKVSGILCEVFSLDQKPEKWLIAGLGLNLHGRPKDWPSELQRNTTSLENEGVSSIAPVDFLRILLPHLEREFYQIHNPPNPNRISELNDLLALKGDEVQIHNSSFESTRYRIQGFNHDGALKAIDENGVLHRFYSGDITLSRIPSK